MDLQGTNGAAGAQIVTEIPSSLKQLARLVVRAFYCVEDALIIDMLVRNPCMKEDDICELLKFERKMLRAKMTTLKADKFLQVRLRMETGPDGKAQKVNYYFINYKSFVNVVKYKLDMMRKRMETEERDATSRASFKCPSCLKTFTDLEADQLFDFMSQEFLCTYCKQVVEEDQSAIPKKDSRMQLAKFNEQIEPLFVLLRQVEGIKLAPELLEPEPVDISTIRGIDKSRLNMPRGGGDQWSGEATRHGGFAAEETHVDVTISGAGDNGVGASAVTVAKKDRPVWMAESTVVGRMDNTTVLNEQQDDLSGMDNLTAIGGKQSAPDDIMSVLLQHEKRGGSSNGAGLSSTEAAVAAVKSVLQPDSNSDSSDNEIRDKIKGEIKSEIKEEVKEMSSDGGEDNDDVPTVIVGGKQIPITLVDNSLIAKMTAAEKDAYIHTYQEYYANLYD